MKVERGLKEVGVGNKKWDKTIGGGTVVGKGREERNTTLCVCASVKVKPSSLYVNQKLVREEIARCLVVAMRSAAETPLFTVFQEYVR